MIVSLVFPQGREERASSWKMCVLRLAVGAFFGLAKLPFGLYVLKEIFKIEFDYFCHFGEAWNQKFKSFVEAL